METLFIFLSSHQPVRFPVTMTSPPTAILYIAEDFEDMTQLKDTLHVKEVEIGMNASFSFLLETNLTFNFCLFSSSSCT